MSGENAEPEGVKGHPALMGVWDNIDMAKFFIAKARAARKGEHDIRFRWCLNIAAGGLWSAMDILIDKMKIKEANSASDWFKDNEELVNQIRHGAVHYNPAQGVGQSFSPRRRDGEDTNVFRTFSPGVDDEETTSFLWIGEGSQQEQIPIDEVVSRLDTACELVKDTVFERTGVQFINFG